MISQHQSKSGFTLVEILVVIVIIVILASIVTINVANKPDEARVSAATVQLNQLKSAVKMYKIENGRVPTQTQGLKALVQKPTVDPVPQSYPPEGYLDSRNLPLDPWRNPYIYLAPGRQGESFEIITYGSDGEKGGEGSALDLTSAAL